MERFQAPAGPLEYWSLLDLSQAIRGRAISSVEATRQMLMRIEALDGVLKSYVAASADHAMGRAQAADQELARGLWRGPLHGVPLALKDLCFTTFAPTAGGMKIFEGAPAPYDGTAVARLEQAGAVILGKLKMTEGATSAYHPEVVPPLNPWSQAHWTGMSSSGSGVATAAGLCFGSLGSDTGGSIRFPSAACGLTGVKPTWGRVSRHGIFHLAESLDHLGPMARSAADAAAILGVIAGEDENDPTSLTAPVPDYLAELGVPIRGLTVGVDRSYGAEGVEPQVLRAMEEAERVLASLGARIREVQFPPAEPVIGNFMMVANVELAEAHRATYPAQAGGYGPKVAGMIEGGLAASALDIAAAARARRIFCGQVQRLWRDIDLLLIPAMPWATPTNAGLLDMLREPKRLGDLVRFEIPFDMTGSPTLSLPCGMSVDGLPIGLQLVGPHLSENLLLRAGHAFQQATDWHVRRPDLSWAQG